MTMITFKEYLIGKDVNYINNIQPLMEMAQQGNVERMPVLFDEDDIKFLKVFEPKYWSDALFQRYSIFLKRALKIRCEQRLELSKDLFNTFEKIGIDYAVAYHDYKTGKNKNIPVLSFAKLKDLNKKHEINITDDYINNLENELKTDFPEWIEKYVLNNSEQKQNDNLEKFASLETHNVLKNFKPLPVLDKSRDFNPKADDVYVFSKGKDLKGKRETRIKANSYILSLIAKLEQDKGVKHVPEAELGDQVGKYGYDLSPPHERNTDECLEDIFGIILPTEATFRSSINKFLSDNFHEYYGVVHDYENYDKSKPHIVNQEIQPPDLVSLAKYHKNKFSQDRSAQEAVWRFLTSSAPKAKLEIEEMEKRYGKEEIIKAKTQLKNIINKGFCSYEHAIERTLDSGKILYPDFVTLERYYKKQLLDAQKTKELTKIMYFVKLYILENNVNCGNVPIDQDENFKKYSEEDIKSKITTMKFLNSRYNPTIVSQSACKLLEIYSQLQSDPMSAASIAKNQRELEKPAYEDNPPTIQKALTTYNPNEHLEDTFAVESEKNRLESRLTNLLKTAFKNNETKEYSQSFLNREDPKNPKKDSLKIIMHPLDKWIDFNITDDAPENINKYIEKYAGKALNQIEKDTYIKKYNKDPNEGKMYLLQVGREFFRQQGEKLAKEFIAELIDRQALPIPFSDKKYHSLHIGHPEHIIKKPENINLDAQHKDYGKYPKGKKPKHGNIILPHYKSETQIEVPEEVIEKDASGNDVKKIKYTFKKKPIDVPVVRPSSYLRQITEDDLDENGELRSDLNLNVTGYHRNKIRITPDEYLQIANIAGTESKQALNLNKNQMKVDTFPQNSHRYHTANKKIETREKFGDLEPVPISKISGDMKIQNFKNNLYNYKDPVTGKTRDDIQEYPISKSVFYAIADVYFEQKSEQERKKILSWFENIDVFCREKIKENLQDFKFNFDYLILSNEASEEEYKKWIQENEKIPYKNWLENYHPNDYKKYIQNQKNISNFKNKLKSKIRSLLQHESHEGIKSYGTRRKSQKSDLQKTQTLMGKSQEGEDIATDIDAEAAAEKKSKEQAAATADDKKTAVDFRTRTKLKQQQQAIKDALKQKADEEFKKTYDGFIDSVSELIKNDKTLFANRMEPNINNLQDERIHKINDIINNNIQSIMASKNNTQKNMLFSHLGEGDNFSLAIKEIWNSGLNKFLKHI